MIWLIYNFFKKAAFLFTLTAGWIFSAFSAVDIPVKDCGPVFISPFRALNGTDIWILGDQLVYEFSGGLSVIIQGAAPTFPFQKPNERVVQVLELAPQKTLILTRQVRGVGIYVWDQTNVSNPALIHLRSEILQTQDSGKKIMSPLVDAASDRDRIYLLSNFHIHTLKKQDLLQGRYIPSVERLQGCSAQNESCPRGVALFQFDDWVGVAQMKTSTGKAVTLGLGFQKNVSPLNWRVTTLDILQKKRSYTNVLKSRRSISPSLLTLSVDGESVDHQVLNGAGEKNSLSKVSQFVQSASFMSEGPLAEVEGVLSYKDGSYVYKGGQRYCRAFAISRGVLINKENGQLKIYGFSASGFLMTAFVQ